MEQLLDKYITTALYDFGKEVNTNRQLPLVFDGMKPVFRRVLYTAIKFGNKMMKTAAITGTTMATLHPHSSDAIDNTVASLARWGMLDSQGNFGMKLIYGDDIRPSSSRYTEAKINDTWNKLISFLLPYVPYVEAEMQGNIEPEYIPTPIPLILLFSGMGIGYGANCRFPMFTAKSLYDAMLSDDPYKLEAPNGLSIDFSQSDIEDLWNTGIGKVCYKYKVEKCGISSGYGSMISGSAEIFKPNLEKGFEEELAKGQVYILDQTAGDIPAVFVGRSPNVRAISLDDIQEVCEQLCTYSRTFRLTVTDGEQAYCIPLKNWLRECYENYLNLIEVYKQDQISKLKFDHKVYTWLGTITEYLLAHRDQDSEDIAKNTNCELEVVKSILRKSISTLRNTDSTAKLKGIEEQIKYFESIVSADYVESVINEF